jgi:hypothetical protein
MSLDLKISIQKVLFYMSSEDFGTTTEPVPQSRTLALGKFVGYWNEGQFQSATYWMELAEELFISWWRTEKKKFPDHKCLMHAALHFFRTSWSFL